MPFGKRQPSGFGGVERRREPRERADIPAHIILPGSQFVKCRVADLSRGGARLAVASVFGLPDAFEVRGLSRKCRVQVVRRGVGLLAVHFV
jgi:hypothetical protein